MVLNALGAEKGRRDPDPHRLHQLPARGWRWTAQLRDERSGAPVRRPSQRRRQRRALGQRRDRPGRGLNSARNVRLVKGSHIIVPKFWEGRQAYLVQNSDKRVIFINPLRGRLGADRHHRHRL